MLLKAKGQLEEAIACYREAIRFKPGYVMAHRHLGNALLEKGQLDEAVACCREIVRLRPDYAPAYSNLGNTLRRNGQLDEAIACCREAIRLKPDLTEAHNNLELPQGKRAAWTKPSTVTARPSNSSLVTPLPTLFNLGNALSQIGKLDDAFAC